VNQLLPTGSDTGSGPQCGWGFCEKPATVHVTIHYPAAVAIHGAFEWSGFRCEEDLAAEVDAATLVGATVEVERSVRAVVSA
jgi:hypothetical protein